MKPFKEVIYGIRKAVMASEVREDIAQMGEYVEQFASTATTKAAEAAASAEAAAESASNASATVSAAIDPTLSLSGKAADAAKVGEAVNAEAERAKGVENQIKEDIYFNEPSKSTVSSVSNVEAPHNDAEVSFDGDKVFTKRTVETLYIKISFDCEIKANVEYQMCFPSSFVNGNGNEVSIYKPDGSKIKTSYPTSTWINVPFSSDEDLTSCYVMIYSTPNYELESNGYVFITNDTSKISQDLYEPRTIYEVKTDRIFKMIDNKIDIYPSENIFDFYNSMVHAYNHKNMKVYIHSGNYEYTTELVDYIREHNERGVPIGNGCKYYFDTCANIICNYRGSRTDAQTMFSPLDSKNSASDWEIHNLTLEASNCLYGLHDECSGSDIPYRHIYDNCRIVLDNTGFEGGFNRAIGGGLGTYADIIHRNCYYEATTNDKDVSYHGNNLGDNANIVVTGTYFNSAFAVDTPPRGNGIKNLIYCGNCSKTDIVFSQSDDTWKVLKWGNTIRN